MTVSAYLASKTYNSGDEVTINGITYHANWWVSGQDPSINNGGVGTGQPWTVVTSTTGSTAQQPTPVPSTAPVVTAAAYST